MNRSLLYILGWCVLVVLSVEARVYAKGPNLNDRFPVNERNLSAPIVDEPIHTCALAVHVRAFIPKAQVQVFANGTEVGRATPFIGEGDIKLTRALAIGDVITARQTVSSVVSAPSNPVPVTAYPALTTPVAGPKVYACGQVIPVSNLIASTHVRVSDLTAGNLGVIGEGDTTGVWAPIFTSPLVAGHAVQAVQIACPASPNQVLSAPSRKLVVSTDPSPVPPPKVDPQVIQGADVITLHSLLPGAALEIKANGTVLSSGQFANDADNWVPLQKPVPAGNPQITATQALCNASGPSAPVVASSSLQAPILGAPICPGSSKVSVQNTVAGATLVIYRQPAGSSTRDLIGQVGATLGATVVSLAGGVTLHAGDRVGVIEYYGSIVSPSSNEVAVDCGGNANVITQHNDNGRTGAYLAETNLSPASIKADGMSEKFRRTLRGTSWNQLLYVAGVSTSRVRRNLVIATTLNNWIQAIDADQGVEVWSLRVEDIDKHARSTDLGIPNTPVVDPASNRLYVLAETGNMVQGVDSYAKAGVDMRYWLVAVDIRTGQELQRIQIAGTAFAGNGEIVPFIGAYQRSHPALLLDQGYLYVGFGSVAESEGAPNYPGRFHGWVLRYQAQNLSQSGAFFTSPPSSSERPNVVDPTTTIEGSGVWQGGGGMASDPDGNIFFLVGNGRFDPNTFNFGDSFVKLTMWSGGLWPTAYAPPLPEIDKLEVNDADLGSGGPLYIPGTNLLVGGGKTGMLYLVDRQAMQLKQAFVGSTNTWDPTLRDQSWDAGPHLHNSPTYWRGTHYLYIWGEKDYLHAYAFNDAAQKFNATPAKNGSIQAPRNAMPGGMLALSGDGLNPATGVLWAIHSLDDVTAGGPPSRAELVAFDARDLSILWRVTFGKVPHWATPIVANGRVYVTNNDGELIAYGLIGERAGRSATTPAPSPCVACHTSQQQRELADRNPMSKFFINEAEVNLKPAATLRLLPTHEGYVKAYEFEGNGRVKYVAAEVKGKLEWSQQELTANLTQTWPFTRAELVRLRLDPGPEWTASDGSRLKGRLEATVPPPVDVTIPWMSFIVVGTKGHGVLAGKSVAQMIYTHGGHAPATAPTSRSDVITVPFTAIFRFLESTGDTGR